jgi:mannose-6-phosphate isomerase-like protein (cupin superfamily)
MTTGLSAGGPRHLVRPAAEAAYIKPTEPWAGDSSGFTRWSIVDETVSGAVHTGFAVSALEPSGHIPAKVQSYEESFFVLEGNPVLRGAGWSSRLQPGDYGLVPVGVPHSWHNPAEDVARWAQMLSPQPRSRFAGDAFVVQVLPESDPDDVDVRDPRTRSLGHIDPAHMDPALQGQQHLAVTASMRTALLVYGGITVKMMVDSDLGADLATMFMVYYDPDGATGPHDHPFEETYMFLEGTVEATFDGEPYELAAGDVAFAGVGCPHSFRNLGGGPLRWLETQAPQPPGRHSYRFARDWDYLEARLKEIS